MQMNISEKDKKLLVYLAIFCLIIVPFWFVMRPAMAKGNEIKGELETALAERVQMETEIVKYQSNLAALDENRKLYEQEISEINPVMPNNRIDSMITDMVTNCGLEIIRLSISNNANMQNESPYKYSKMAIEAEAEENSSDDEAEPVLYIAGVNITARGAEDNIYRLMDAISSRMPAIRATSYSTSVDADSGAVTLNASIDVYMAESSLAVEESEETTEETASSDETENS